MERAVVEREKTRESTPSSILFPMLTNTNYTVWAMRMKVALKAHRVWEAIDPGSTEPQKNDVATALLFQSVPETLILQIGEQDTAKGMWEAIKSRHMGADRVRDARLQTLNAEFDRLMMRDSDSIDDFVGKLSELSSKSVALGQTMEESKLVKKFLSSLPQNKFIHIVASLEQVLDLNTTTFEDIVGRLKAYEERIGGETPSEDQEKLMFGYSEEQSWRGGFCGHGRGRGVGRGRGRGRGRGYTPNQNNDTMDQNENGEKLKKDRTKVICYRCDKMGHYAASCPERRQQHQANLVETQEADVALFMHEVLFLNEEKVIPKKYELENKREGFWYLDNGASNHMTGVKSYFSELNERVTGKIKFGDGSCIEIKGKGSILFKESKGGQMILNDIYFIPGLKTNIISLGQTTEVGCEVSMKGDHLTMHDQGGRLLMSVTRSSNRLYKIKLRARESMGSNEQDEGRSSDEEINTGQESQTHGDGEDLRASQVTPTPLKLEYPPQQQEVYDNLIELRRSNRVRSMSKYLKDHALLAEIEGITLFERLAYLYGDEIKSMLTVQHRMHEFIMNWSSLFERLAKSSSTKATLLLVDTVGCDMEEKKDEEESTYNKGEAEVAKAHAKRLMEIGVQPSEIGIIMPYAAQVMLLRILRSKEEKLKDMEVSTVDSFQGREKEAIIISMVRSNSEKEVGFLKDQKADIFTKPLALVLKISQFQVRKLEGRLLDN